jgi:hypothetical protein
MECPFGKGYMMKSSKEGTTGRQRKFCCDCATGLWNVYWLVQLNKRWVQDEY